MDKLVDTSDSARSQDVLTESMDGSSYVQDSVEESKTPKHGSTLEMVDLSKKSKNTFD
jgi:hypothetical protein